MTEKTRFCSKCGAPIQGDARFCPNCGAKLDDTPEPASAPGRKTYKRKQSGLKITVPMIVAATVVIVCAAAAFVVHDRMPEKSKLFSEAIAVTEGNTVWYHVKEEGEEIKVISAFVFEPGQTLRYYVSPTKDGKSELSYYADRKEVVNQRNLRANYLSHYYAAMNTARTEDIPNLNREIDLYGDDFTEDDVDEISRDGDAFMDYCELTDALPCSYRLFMNDGREVLAFNAETEPGVYNRNGEHQWNGPGISTHYMVIHQEKYGPVRVNRKYYKGFRLDEEGEYLITKCPKATEISLDTIDSLGESASRPQIREIMSDLQKEDYERLKTHYDPEDPAAEKPEMPKRNSYFEGKGMHKFVRVKEKSSELF